jgi:DinB superfamily
MTDLVKKDPATAAAQQIITQIINNWKAQNKAVTSFINKYEDSVYLKEVAAGRNRAVYIFGHLIASSDNLLPMFGLGESLFPAFPELFAKNPDRTFADLPTIAELRQAWETINNTLTEHFNNMSIADWLSRHSRVSEEDFALDPLRNKLNVLISRTIHEGYHLGQLILLKA